MKESAEYYLGIMHLCIDLIEKIDNEEVKTIDEMRDALLDAGHKAKNDCDRIWKERNEEYV